MRGSRGGSCTSTVIRQGWTPPGKIFWIRACTINLNTSQSKVISYLHSGLQMIYTIWCGSLWLCNNICPNPWHITTISTFKLSPIVMLWWWRIYEGGVGWWMVKNLGLDGGGGKNCRWGVYKKWTEHICCKGVGEKALVSDTG